MTIEPFGCAESCPKCHCIEISTCYENAGKAGEYLTRLCSRCGYGWREQTADAAQDTEVQSDE